MVRRLPRASPPSDIDLNPRRNAALDFEDRPFEAMTPADYDAIGFMCGLEVHQQLQTVSKLFCRCPAGETATRVDAEVLRHMRPTLSEMGEYDGTALMEFKTRKEIVYLLERGSVCTYEMDDTPPFPIDEEAVRIALEVSRLFNLNLVSELQVMRKQYLDGSIPTGFQRTAMVGVGGEIPFRDSELGGDRVVRIRQLTLEEDSCREVSDVGHRITFRTDRLGMPLIETVTEPDLLTPRDVMEGGRLLSRVARVSGAVRRGAGAARQDVNVSVAGGRRVEIKGVPQHKQLPRLVHNEAFRQLNLLRIRAQLRKRGVAASDLKIPADRDAWESDLVIDARPSLRRCNFDPIRDALARQEMICAVRLPGFGGLLKHRTQPGVTFVRELADRVRVIACLTSRPFLLGSDSGEWLSVATWRQLQAALSADQADAIIVLWGPPEDVETGAREVLIRAGDAVVGVPSETRQSLRDGTTGFERILPGPERMYPDTDTPPLPILDGWVVDDTDLGELPWNREDRYRKRGLSVAASARLVASDWADLFDAVGPCTPLSACRLAAALEKRLVHYWRERGGRELPEPQRLVPLVRAVEQQTLRPEAFEAVFDRLLREADEAAVILADYAPRSQDSDRLAAAIVEARKARDDLPFEPRDPAAALRWALGEVMPQVLGRLDPADVRGAIARALELGGETTV